MNDTDILYGLDINDLKDIIKVLNKFTMVQSAVLFGSRAMGNQRKGSDIDIALKGSISYHDLLEILVVLDKLELPYSFDILIYNNISEPALKEHIQRIGKILF